MPVYNIATAVGEEVQSPDIGSNYNQNCGFAVGLRIPQLCGPEGIHKSRIHSLLSRPFDSQGGIRCITRSAASKLNFKYCHAY